MENLASMGLNLEDLTPQEATFSLSTKVGKQLVIRRWSLFFKSWSVKKFGEGGFNDAFKKRDPEVIAQLVWEMLKPDSKKEFADYNDFLDSISSTRDIIAMTTAFCATVGIGEPEMKQIEEYRKAKAAEGVDPNAQGTNLQK